jgi:hypothetical protein
MNAPSMSNSSIILFIFLILKEEQDCYKSLSEYSLYPVPDAFEGTGFNILESVGSDHDHDHSSL